MMVLSSRYERKRMRYSFLWRKKNCEILTAVILFLVSITSHRHLFNEYVPKIMSDYMVR